MTQRETKVPDAEHPIEIGPTTRRVQVYVGDVRVADSTSALVLDEHGYPPVHYLPLEDVDADRLRPSATRTWCPYKGEATYLGVDGPEGIVEDAAWTYPAAHDAVAAITGRLAWDTAKVRVEVS